MLMYNYQIYLYFLLFSFLLIVLGIYYLTKQKEKGKGELSAIQEVERDYNCQVFSIIDFDDLLQFIEQSEQYAPYLAKMRAYREQYGV